MDIFFLRSFIPEFFLIFSILLLVLFNVQLINLKSKFPIINKEIFSQTFIILVCLFFLCLNQNLDCSILNSLFINGKDEKMIKLLIATLNVFILFILIEAFSFQDINFFEFFTLYLFSVLLVFLLISSFRVSTFYFALEMQAFAFYAMASFKNDSYFSYKAGLKYIVLGTVFSTVVLVGMIFLYGVSGSMDSHHLNLFLFSGSRAELAYVIYLGLVSVFCSLLFKFGHAPFHYWSSDIYEGSPLASEVFFSLLTKSALLIFFIRFVYSIEFTILGVKEVLLCFGCYYVLMGTFFSMSRYRIKKLMIYSSISQICSLIAAISCETENYFSSLMYFFIFFVLTSSLLWALITLFHSFRYKISFFFFMHFETFYTKFFKNFIDLQIFYIKFFENLTDFYIAWLLTSLIVFFSMAGIPFLNCFLKKVLILFDLTYLKPFVIYFILLLGSSIGVFYHLRLTKSSLLEPKYLKKKEYGYKVTFTNFLLDLIYFYISFILVASVLFFFC